MKNYRFGKLLSFILAAVCCVSAICNGNINVLAEAMETPFSVLVREEGSIPTDGSTETGYTSEIPQASEEQTEPSAETADTYEDLQTPPGQETTIITEDNYSQDTGDITSFTDIYDTEDTSCSESLTSVTEEIFTSQTGDTLWSEVISTITEDTASSIESSVLDEYQDTSGSSDYTTVPELQTTVTADTAPLATAGTAETSDTGGSEGSSSGSSDEDPPPGTQTDAEPTPVPTPTVCQDTLYPCIRQEFTVVDADDGRTLSLSGSYPPGTEITGQPYSCDYVMDTVLGYSFTPSFADGCNDPRNPVTVTLDLTSDDPIAIYEITDGGIPIPVCDYSRVNSTLSFTLTALNPFVIARVAASGYEEQDVSCQTLEAVIYTDASYSAAAARSDISISITGLLPEGTTARAYEVPSDEENVVVAFDITLFDAGGNEYQPEYGAVNVVFEGSVVREAMSDAATDLVITHEEHDGTEETIEAVASGDDFISFDAESFSIYKVVQISAPDLTDESYIILGINGNKYALMNDVLGNPNSGSHITGFFLGGIDVTSAYDAGTGLLVRDGTMPYWTFEECTDTTYTYLLGRTYRLQEASASSNGPKISVTMTANNCHVYYLKAPNQMYLGFDHVNRTSGSAPGGWYQGFTLSDTPSPLIVITCPDGSGRIAIAEYNESADEFHFLRCRYNTGNQASRAFEQCPIDDKKSETMGYWFTLFDIAPSTIVQYRYIPVADGEAYNTIPASPGNIAIQDLGNAVVAGDTFILESPSHHNIITDHGSNYVYQSGAGQSSLEYTYQFVGWTPDDGTTVLQPGVSYTVGSANVGNPDNPVVLSAVWRNLSKTYIIYDNTPATGDTGAYNDLPVHTTSIEIDSVTAGQTYQLLSPADLGYDYDPANGYWYYESWGGTDGLRHVYKLTGWADQDNNIVYGPSGDVLTFTSSNPAIYTLTPVWEEVESFIRIVYDGNLPTHLDRTGNQYAAPVEESPTLIGFDGTTGTKEYDESAIPDNYLLASLSNNYYQYYTGGGDGYDIGTAVFNGWMAEDGQTVVHAGAVISRADLLALDSDSDGVIHLTGNWSSGDWSYAVFSVRLEAEDIYDNPYDGNNISHLSNAGDFSRCVYGAGVLYTNSGNVQMRSNDSLGKVFVSSFSYAEQYGMGTGDEHLVSDGADTLIRSSVDNPIHGDNAASLANSEQHLDYSGITFQLVEFPDDELIFERLRYYVPLRGRYFREDGQQIDISEINSENYTIRWCVVKHENGTAWRIDGVLIKKQAFLTINKTFEGSVDAMNAAITNPTDPFTIRITRILPDPNDPDNEHPKDHLSEDAEDTIHLLVQPPNVDNYNLLQGLLLEDPSDPDGSPPLLDRAGHRQYGYVQYDAATNTYTWNVEVPQGGKYYIEEENYHVDDFGVITQFSVVTTDGLNDVSLRQWYGIIEAESTGEAKDTLLRELRNGNSLLFNTANLTNTYSRLDIFRIMKVKDDTSGTPISDVRFNVYQLTSGNEVTASDLDAYIASHEPLRFWRDEDHSDENEVCWTPTRPRPDSPDGQLINTEADGSLIFYIQNTDSSAESKYYLISEVLPDGYVDPAPAIILKVTTVNIDGHTYPRYTVIPLRAGSCVSESYFMDLDNDGSMYPTADGGYVRAGIMAAQVTGESYYEPLTAGILVKNIAEKVEIDISKTWGPNAQGTISQVTATITGYYADTGAVYMTRDIVLNESNNWTYSSEVSQDIYPAHVNDRDIRYMVEETKIGPYSQSSPQFRTWDQVGVVRYYVDRNDPLSEITRNNFEDARYINAPLRNVTIDIVPANIDVYYHDYETHLNIGGGAFEVYGHSDTGTETILFGASSDTCELEQTFTFDGMEPVHLSLEAGVYYIRQLNAAAMYRKVDDIVKVTVDTQGNAVFETYSASDPNSDMIQTDHTVGYRVIFHNERITPAPTGYTSTMLPMMILLLGGLGLLCTVLFGKPYRPRKHKIRKVRHAGRLKEVVLFDR